MGFIDPRTILVLLLGFVIAIAVHEFSHAAVARLLGDRTAQQAGRLTLNPIRHLDPFGSLLILLTVASGAPGIGWGKPVPVNPRALRYGRAGMALVSAAGPIANLVLATLVLAVASHIDLPAPIGEQDVETLVLLNVSLCAFNLLPIAPLDGFGVAVGVLPQPIAYQVARLGRYGSAILLLLVFSASIIRVSLLGLILRPIIQFLLTVIIRIAGAF